MATTYVVTGVDTGIPSLPNDSVIHGLHVGQTFTATLDSGVEAELIAAGLIAKSPVSSPVSVAADGSLVAADGRTLPVVSVASGTPTDGQFAVFNGDGSKVVPGAGGGGGGGGPAFEKPYGIMDAADGDFIEYTGFGVAPAGITDGSPTLIGTGFDDTLIGVFVDDDYWDGSIATGTTVLSVESSTSLTMSADANFTDDADEVAFGLRVNLPAPTVGHRIGFLRAAGTYGNDPAGGLFRLAASSGLVLGGATADVATSGERLVIIGDGTDWQIESQTIAPAPAWDAGSATPGAQMLHSAASGGYGAVAEGNETTASGLAAHAEGWGTTASEAYCHAEGFETSAGQAACHAEGTGTNATGVAAHAEGNGTIASGDFSHATGYKTQALGTGSAAFGGCANAFAYWYWAFSSGAMADGERSQYAFWLPFNTTIDATPTALGVANPVPPGPPNQHYLNLPDAITTALVEARVVARRTDVPGTASAWDLAALVDGDGVSTYRIVGSQTKSVAFQDAAASTWDVNFSIEFDTSLVVTVTGEAGKTIAWTCTLKLYEIAA